MKINKSNRIGTWSVRVRLATLLGTASFVTMAKAKPRVLGEVVAQAEEIPEMVLITGSLIRGTTRGRCARHQSGPRGLCHGGRYDHRRSVPDLPGRERAAQFGRNQHRRDHRARRQSQPPRPGYGYRDAIAA